MICPTGLAARRTPQSDLGDRGDLDDLPAIAEIHRAIAALALDVVVGRSAIY